MHFSPLSLECRHLGLLSLQVLNERVTIFVYYRPLIDLGIYSSGSSRLRARVSVVEILLLALMMVMAPGSLAEEERRHPLHLTIDSIHLSSLSIHSFNSSSETLNSTHLNLEPEEEDEKLFDLDEQHSSTDAEQDHIFTTQPLPRPSWRQTPLTPTGLANLAQQIILSLVLLLLPSFFFRSHVRRKLHSTSYLDGLRGIAALIVFLDHFVLNWYYTLRSGYLSSPEDSSFLQLPIIRLVVAGRASVGVFFAISGFVLSYKPLKQIRAGDNTGVLDTLASSVFRRSIRLYTPLIFGTFMSAYLAQNGYYTPVPARTELMPPQLPTMRDQLHHWYLSIQALIMAGLTADPNRPYAPPYNGHLWTIPVEFFGSMVVFLAILATSKAQPAARIAILSILAGWSLQWGRWDICLFLGGAVVAEWNLIATSDSDEDNGLPYHDNIYSFSNVYPLTPFAPSESVVKRLSNKLISIFTRVFEPLSAFKTPLTIFLLLFSLYLLSYAGESPSPGLYHRILTPYIPAIYSTIHLGPEHFILALGALLLLLTLSIPTFTSPSFFRAIQKPLLSPLAQYLGDISYSMYIVHGLVLFTLGTGLQERWTGQVGEEKWVDNGMGELVEAVVRLELDKGAYWKAFWLCAGINALVCFWVADLFWRGVDGRTVRVGKWFEGLVMGNNERR
jgi:peptidoglycan/LPS O-acetylase OafA/YrhL